MNTVYVSRQYFSDDKPRDMFRCASRAGSLAAMAARGWPRNMHTRIPQLSLHMHEYETG